MIQVLPTSSAQQTMKALLAFVMGIIVILCMTVDAYPLVPDSLGNIDIPGTPAGLAVDGRGRVLVSDTLARTVNVYANNGILLRTIQAVERPLGIGVAADGTMYVADGARGGVTAFTEEGAPLHVLGVGDGEFLYPNDITVTPGGTVMVTDSKAREVRVYDPTGGWQQSFGNTVLTFPTGITVDPSNGDIYVADDSTKYIYVFRSDGTYLRGIRLGGWFSPRALRPQGLAIKGNSIFVSDAFNSTIAEFTKTGSFIQYIGNYGMNPGEFRTPLDIAFDNDGKLFVANHNNKRIEHVGWGGSYTDLVVAPEEIAFTATQEGLPLSTNVTIDSGGPGDPWQASVSEAWLGVSGGSGVTPGQVLVSANPTGLANGTYTGFVRLASNDAVERVVRVLFTVDIYKALEVAPATLELEHRIGATSYSEGTIHISSLGGSFPWVADTNADWLALNVSSGLTPASVGAHLAELVNEMPVGTYSSSITVDAGQMDGSPGVVQVNLRVIRAGRLTVRTNLDEAAFTVTGPADYRAGGRLWNLDEVEPGDYTIAFEHVPGYARPWTKSLSIASAETVEITAMYRSRPVGTHLVVLPDSPDPLTAHLMALDTGAMSVLDIFQPVAGARITGFAIGDMNGDGSDEIVVGDSTGHIEVYEGNGVLFAAADIEPSVAGYAGLGFTEGVVLPAELVDVALSDIDQDGKDDILSAAYAAGQVSVRVHGVDGNGALVDKGLLVAMAGRTDPRLLASDIDCDGAPELIVGDLHFITAFEVAGEDPVGEIWKLRRRGRQDGLRQADLGDINGDGCSEIIVAREAQDRTKTYLDVYDGAGTALDIPFEDLGNVLETTQLSVGSGDVDGDSVDEIVLGTSLRNRRDTTTLFQIFEGSGLYSGTEFDFSSEGIHGVKIDVGTFGGGL